MRHVNLWRAGGGPWAVVCPPLVQRHVISGTRLIGYSKLAVCVNVSANGCWCLPVSPLLASLPYGNWERLQPSHDPELDQQKEIDG